VTLVSKVDTQKLQRIEKLIGYKVNVVPLPSFIASDHYPDQGHRPAPIVLHRQGKFRRKSGNRRYRQGSKDK
jgi:hypothetical protein